MPDRTAAGWVGEAAGWYQVAADRDHVNEDRTLYAALAGSAAQIASAMVFIQDVETVTAQAVEEAGVNVQGLQVAVERLAEATRVLQKATETGPRHPAIHAALAILTGETSLGTPEPRRVQTE